jgi:hypothetical protein
MPVRVSIVLCALIVIAGPEYVALVAVTVPHVRLAVPLTEVAVKCAITRTAAKASFMSGEMRAGAGLFRA